MERRRKGTEGDFKVFASAKPPPLPFICENELRKNPRTCAFESRGKRKEEREREMKFCRVLVGTVSVFQPLLFVLLPSPEFPAVQTNMVKGCVREYLVHATSDQVNFGQQCRFLACYVALIWRAQPSPQQESATPNFSAHKSPFLPSLALKKQPARIQEKGDLLTAKEACWAAKERESV